MLGEDGEAERFPLSCLRFVGVFRAWMLSPGMSVRREVILVAEYIML